MQSAIKVYRHGLSCGVIASKGPGQEAAKRGDVSGWTVRSSKGNTRFLWSVVQDELTGIGVSFSLTARDCPDSHDDWKRKREAWIVRLRRMGLIRLHWITEMQARGVPHMHAMAYFDPAKCPPEFAEDAGDYFRLMGISHWLAVAAEDFGSSTSGQHAAVVYDEVGWLKYLAKHAARGGQHYQRCKETLPAGWQGQTGRMWGHIGSWPLQEPVGVELRLPIWWEFRRLYRAYRRSEARSLPPGRRRSRAISYARRCLRFHAPRALPGEFQTTGRYRGISGWIPEAVTNEFLFFLERERGFLGDPPCAESETDYTEVEGSSRSYDGLFSSKQRGLRNGKAT